MGGSDGLDFDAVDGALQRFGAQGGVAEVHGSFCGLACFLGAQAGPVWIAGLTIFREPTESDSTSDPGVLSEVAAHTLEALSQGDMSFSPLLPPDDRPLPTRAAGLAEWCAGFMHGLGEAAGHHDAQEALGSDIAREIMTDFAEIVRVSLDTDETELEAETAYTDLVEYVRVSVQILFEDLHGVRQSLAAGRIH
jgi:hypothetical protein